MKKKNIVIVLMSLLSLVLVFSCSKEEIDTDSPQKSLLGKWKVIEGGLDYTNLTETWEFKSDNTFHFGSDAYKDPDANSWSAKFTLTSKWSVDDGKYNGYIKIYDREDYEPIEYHCWIENNKMTITPKDYESGDVYCFISPTKILIRQ